MYARARVRFHGGEPTVQYQITYIALVPRRGRMGLPYIARERREEWVDWRTYQSYRREWGIQ